MKIKDILKTDKHRPWKLPINNWKFYQEWNNAIFLHWQVDLNELKKHVPNEIEIDLFDGNPWVSMVAFSMENLRHKNLPSFSPISNFDEINIRTYVKYKGKSGVFFLSIEGGTILSCKLAKEISELPYRFSKIFRDEINFHSLNSEYNDELKMQYVIGKRISKKEAIDKWLTERYALFQDTKNSINGFEIHHIEWPINKIEITSLSLNYNRFNKLINNNPDRIHYSKGVEVIAWDKNKTKRTRPI